MHCRAARRAGVVIGSLAVVVRGGLVLFQMDPAHSPRDAAVGPRALQSRRPHGKDTRSDVEWRLCSDANSCDTVGPPLLEKEGDRRGRRTASLPQIAMQAALCHPEPGSGSPSYRNKKVVVCRPGSQCDSIAKAKTVDVSFRANGGAQRSTCRTEHLARAASYSILPVLHRWPAALPP